MATTVKGNRIQSAPKPSGHKTKAVEIIPPSEIGARIRKFRKEVMGQSMAELAKDLGVSKTTVYRAENGKQAFNYKLLFRLVMHGANPDWLLFGRDDPSRYHGQVQLLSGKIFKESPEQLRTVGPAFDRNRSIYFPTKADEKLLRMLREVEALYLQSDESQREALIRLVNSLVGMLGRVSADNPSLAKARRARSYLRLGVVAEREGKFDEALSCYQSALALDETSEAKQKIEALRPLMMGKEPESQERQVSAKDFASESGAASPSQPETEGEELSFTDPAATPVINRRVKPIRRSQKRDKS